jgi:hypothetical protein
MLDVTQLPRYLVRVRGPIFGQARFPSSAFSQKLSDFGTTTSQSSRVKLTSRNPSLGRVSITNAGTCPDSWKNRGVPNFGQALPGFDQAAFRLLLTSPAF